MLKPSPGGETTKEFDEALQADQKAYKESVMLNSAAVTSYLLEALGQRITTVGVGMKDARQIRRWAEGDLPRESNEERLRLLYRIGRMVEIVYDQETARSFLRSTSPALGDRAPIEAIAENDAQAALDAVRYLLEP